MKNELEEAREKINEIDRKMIDLFKERMDAVLKVARYKKENGLPILDRQREEILLEKNLKWLGDESLAKYYKIFLEGVLASSKSYQEDFLQ